MNVVLVGFKASGKSEVGRRLAALLGRPFVDLDGRLEALFAAETGRRLPVRQIYRERGEEGFRRLEARALASALREDGVVLAVGGGTPFCCPEAEGWLRSHFVIYLRVSEGELYRRLEVGGMPPFLAGEDPRGALARLLEERAPTYRSIARLVVEGEGRSPGATAEAILQLAGRALRGVRGGSGV
ncbi:MAG: shikimate kinase [Nitrospinota bacterium]